MLTACVLKSHRVSTHKEPLVISILINMRLNANLGGLRRRVGQSPGCVAASGRPAQTLGNLRSFDKHLATLSFIV